MGQAKSNKVGIVQSAILTMVNMMDSGIIMLPTELTEVETISIISWLAIAVGSMVLARAFIKYGMFSRKSGGMGGYAEYAFGKPSNFMANYTYGVSLLVTNVATATSATGYGTELLDASLSPVQIDLVTIGVLWTYTVANSGDAHITGQISSIIVQGVIIPAVGLCIIGWFWFSPTLHADSWNPHHTPLFSAVGSSAATTLWAFLGLESMYANTDVVENLKHSVPIAMPGGTSGAAVTYIVSTNVAAEIVPNVELVNSTAPLGSAFAQVFTPEVDKVIMALVVMPYCDSLLGWQFTIAQVSKSSSDGGYFPKVFSRVTKVDAPVQGMSIIVIIQSGLTLMTINPSLNSQFSVLINLTVVTSIISYILSVAALVIIQGVANVPPSKARVANPVVFVGAMYNFYALYSSGKETMLYGSIVTLLGWMLYGLVPPRSELKNKHGQKSRVRKDDPTTALFLLNVLTRFSELH